MIIASFVAIGCQPAIPAGTKPVELKLAHMAPAGSILDKSINAWAEKVKKDSNGLITFRMFPAATLISATETYDGVVKGVADLGSSFRYVRAGAELTGLSSMFLTGLPTAEAGSKIVASMWKDFPELRKEWDKTKVLWIHAAGPAVFATTKPVRTQADLKGLSLRVPVPEAADALRALGGTPVSMPLADLVIGIEKGTVHGGTVFKEAIESYKLPIKYINEFSMYSSSNWFMVMNLDSWNKLPASLQKVIDDSAEWGRAESIKAYDAADASAIKYAKGLGVEIITLPTAERAKWLEIVIATYSKKAGELDAKGYPATKLLEYVNKLRK